MYYALKTLPHRRALIIKCRNAYKALGKTICTSTHSHCCHCHSEGGASADESCLHSLPCRKEWRPELWQAGWAWTWVIHSHVPDSALPNFLIQTATCNVNTLEGCILQHREYRQCFTVTINGASIVHLELISYFKSAIFLWKIKKYF